MQESGYAILTRETFHSNCKYLKINVEHHKPEFSVVGQFEISICIKPRRGDSLVELYWTPGT